MLFSKMTPVSVAEKAFPEQVWHWHRVVKVTMNFLHFSYAKSGPSSSESMANLMPKLNCFHLQPFYLGSGFLC